MHVITWFRAAVAVAAVLASMGLAHADSQRVIVFGTATGSPRTAFVEALTIQLAGDAHVETGPTLSATTLAAQIDAAVEVMGARDATVGIWTEVVEPNARVFDLVLYAVGRKRDLALVKVARVAVVEGDDVDRALALKAGEFLDSLIDVPEIERLVVPAPDPAPTTSPRSIVRAFAAIGGGIFAGAGPTQGALGIEGGIRIGRSTNAVEIALAFRLPSAIDRTIDAGTLSIDERASAIGVRALRTFGTTTAVGVDAELGARHVDALGIAMDGVVGRSSRWVPTAGGGGEVRSSLGRVALRAALGIEVALIDQEFTIDQRVVVGLGRVRGTGQLSLVISLH